MKLQHSSFSASLLSILILSVLVLTTGCVTTQKQLDPINADLQTLRMQITKSQEDMASLKQDIQKDTQAQTATLKTDVETIQKNYADIKATHEQTTRDMDISNNRLDDFNDKLGKLEQKIVASEQATNQRMEMAVKNLEDKITSLINKIAAAGNGSATDAQVTANPEDIKDEAALYQTAEQVYLKGQYDSALKYLNNYQERFPEGKLIAGVKFLSAQTHFALQDYPEALKGLNTFITDYPGDDRIPAAC